MQLYVTTSIPTLDYWASAQLEDNPNQPRRRSYLCRLFTPRMPFSLDLTHPKFNWAADNDCFQRFDEDAYVSMLVQMIGRPGCGYVSAPDKVGDAEATLAYFDEWEPVLREHGFPVALVAQDGLKPSMVPWNRVDVLFIGGTNDFKLDPTQVAPLIDEAHSYDISVHMGRVNTIKRLRYAYDLGCDSVDGSSYGRFPRKYMPDALRFLDSIRGKRRVYRSPDEMVAYASA